MAYHTCPSFLKILWLDIQIFPQLQSVLGDERETSSLEALQKVVQIFFASFIFQPYHSLFSLKISRPFGTHDSLLSLRS